MKAIDLNSSISGLINNLFLKSQISRNLFEGQLKKYIKQKIFNNEESQASEVSRQHQFFASWAMYKSYIRNIDKGNISSKVTKRMIESFLGSVLLRKNVSNEKRRIFQNKHGMHPPSFITISPTKKCNLKCIGCYAASSPTTETTLNWTLLNRIMEDAYSNMGMRFFVISGGEPLLYKSENKTILDLAERWNDCFFLMYTNGTLINENIASRMVDLGNITPAISVEGYEAETDARRGNGIYQRIIKAKDNLASVGVPFGLSVTATKENVDILLNESFYDFYFNEFGATYMWVFQYMPIGRDFSEDLMISPLQRLQLHKIEYKILTEKEYFVADFWNSAPMSNGCISCGRAGGYIYINWDGNIMPCVFVPYYHDNINTLYNTGKSLSDALFSSLFVKGRAWQKEYIGDRNNPGNLLTPCFYRDHYKTFYEIANQTQVLPENEDAQKAFNSKEYYEFMLKFDKELEELSSPVLDNLKKNHKTKM
ncbi:MAG TPA: radical SAM protein [Bacteroidales bacterium]|nr:radical SAM protein [Bacteroidales bacterium]